MNELEVEKQIEQMVKFIKQEAEEKANEIKVSAEEEFNLEKLQLLEQEKAKIRKEYERREGQVEVKKKIEYSKTLNEMRIKVLGAREAAIQEVVTEAKVKLRDVSKNPGAYKKLLTDLLVQGARKLNEKQLVVRARQVDLQLVKDSVEPARRHYAQLFPSDEAPQMTVDTHNFLPPPFSGDDDSENCAGGVLLTTPDGRIVCSNTLDERVKISYAANLPEIRSALFGTTAPARN